MIKLDVFVLMFLLIGSIKILIFIYSFIDLYLSKTSYISDILIVFVKIYFAHEWVDGSGISHVPLIHT